MSDVVIKVENLSKQYRLGVINHGTLAKDLQAWWAKKRGKEDPNSQISPSTSSQTLAPDLTLNPSPKGEGLKKLPVPSGKGQGERLKGLEAESFYALRDINFEVRQGEVLGIIGSNGAGKSTLLKILSRVTSPTTGSVKIKGRIGSLLEVGTGFHPELTGRENIYLNGAILGMKRWEIDKKIDEIIDFSGVEKFIDTPVKRYSSGMYVRLAFAVAAHLDPEILVIDEVLAVGDAEFQKKCLGKMDDVSKKEGRTVLFVSHNMAAVRQLCDRGFIVSKGKIIENGPVETLINSYIGMSSKIQEYDQDGYVDLENSRETVYQEKIFKKIRILDKKDKPTDTFKMLDQMKIEVVLQNNDRFTNADYGIIILNSFGQRITSFATWMCKKKNDTTTRRLVLNIPQIKMVNGVYFISLSSTIHSSSEWLDKLDNVMKFKVEVSNILDSGKIFDSSFGMIVPEGELNIFNN